MHSFKKIERLSSKKDITLLFETGKAKTIFPLKVIWRINPHESKFPCRVVIVVPKRFFKHAVQRNLLKRRIREAYRTQKSELYKELLAKGIQLDLMFIYTSKDKLEYSAIKECMSKCIGLISTIDNNNM